jgi:multidrug resistance efflux pump
MPAENKKIFPPEIVEYSVEKHFSEYNPKSKALYLVVLGLLAVFFILLFVIKVDVSVRSTGIIRPLQERTDIRSALDGIIDSMYVSENTHVVAGQPIMKIKSRSVDEKGVALNTERSELIAEVADLRKLVIGRSDSLQSSLYAQQYSLYRQKIGDVQVRYDLVSKSYNRYATLYHQKVISAEEYDKYNYERRAVQSEMSLAKESQQSQWQADLSRLERQLNESGASVTMYEEQKDLHTIKAQVSGTVQELKGIQVGSFVSPNEVLGEISPDSGLIAEAYIPSKDIGMIRIGTKVRMQVDAFDYNTWGMLTGKVQSISSDIYTDSDQPYFKVRCKLDKNALSLRNGYRSFVKKGMTLQARFQITRRSLFQLLYDQTDDWLNPNLVKNGPKEKS